MEQSNGWGRKMVSINLIFILSHWIEHFHFIWLLSTAGIIKITTDKSSASIWQCMCATDLMYSARGLRRPRYDTYCRMS